MSKDITKRLFRKKKQETLDCICRVKTDCPLNGGCRKESVIYKCTATTCDLKKVYLGLTEGGIMTMSNLLKTSFMPTVLPFQVMYGN